MSEAVSTSPLFRKYFTDAGRFRLAILTGQTQTILVAIQEDIIQKKIHN